MKDTQYAFCVARLRAKETTMLTNDFISRLIETQVFEEAVKLLVDKGWILPSETYLQAIKRQEKELWELLSESVPDKKELESLCVLNDYFNIKAAVKCAVTGEDASLYYIYPTTVDINNLTDKIRQKKLNAMSDEHTLCAYCAYDLALKTQNGQNADITVDRAALDTLLSYGEKSKDSIFSRVCRFIVDTSNIKIALRCASADKSKEFIELSVSGCNKLDRDKLIELSYSDIETLIDYLMHSEYKQGVALYKKSPAAYDKWCDDRIVDIIRDSKYVSFGFAPVCAYYYAKLTEIKTVRILLSSKLSGMDKMVIRERVRNLYV